MQIRLGHTKNAYALNVYITRPTSATTTTTTTTIIVTRTRAGSCMHVENGVEMIDCVRARRLPR